MYYKIKIAKNVLNTFTRQVITLTKTVKIYASSKLEAEGILFEKYPCWVIVECLS